MSSSGAFTRQTDLSTTSGTYTVVECWYRELTDERSAPGYPWQFTLNPSGGGTTPTTWPLPSFDNANTAKNIVFTSTAKPLPTELFVSHREFYVARPDLPGVYYLWQRIPYTGNVPGDSTVPESRDLETHTQQRALETSGETNQFPAVTSAVYAWGRLVGAGMSDRVPLNCTITLEKGDDQGILAGANLFREADSYRAVVYIGPNATIAGRDYVSGQIIAFVQVVLNNGNARVTFTNTYRFINANWPYDNLTLTNGATPAACQFSLIGLSKTDLYLTPVYGGEIGGGLSNGLFGYSPFDTVRDNQVYRSAGKAVFIAKCGSTVVIVYEKAVMLAESQFTAQSPPPFSFYQLSDEIGSFNPSLVWTDNDRRFYFWGQGRIYAIEGNRLVDISRRMGIASFAQKFVGATGATIADARPSWNSCANSLLVVGLTKKGAVEADFGKFAVQISFDGPRPTLHPLLFPVRIECAVAVPREVAGVQFNQWLLFGGIQSGTIGNAIVYTYGAPGVNDDKFTDTDAPIPWRIRGGKTTFPWKAAATRLDILFSNPSANVSVVAQVRGWSGNDLATEDFTTATETLNRAALNREMPSLRKSTGRALQLELTGTNNSQPMSIHRVGMVVEPVDPPGMGV